MQGHAGAAAAGGLDGRTREARGAKILKAKLCVGALQNFQAGLQQQLFHEGVAHLHDAAVGGFGIVDGGEGCAVDAVAAGIGADQDQLVAGAAGGGAGELRMLDESHAHGVDQWVATVGGGDGDLAAHGGHAHAVPVPADTADDSVGEIASAPVVQRTEAQAIEDGDRARTHGEYVAEDPADAGGGALERFDGAGVIVALDLHHDREAVANIHGAGVLFAGADEDLGALAGQAAEERAGVLVAAMLAPHAADDPQFHRVGRTVQEIGGEVVFVAGQSDFAEGFVAGRLVGRGNRHAPVTARSDSQIARPSSPPSAGSEARSGWGIMPTTLRRALQIPAMSSTDPLGLASGSRSPVGET